jgi:protease I
MAKNVLIVAGDAVEALEIYYPYYRCLEEGYETVIASPKVKTLYTVVHDFEPHMETYTEKPGYQIQAQVSFADVDPSSFDGLIIPGGRAPEYIRLDENLQRIVRHFFTENKPVAAICHAALVLATVRDLMEGRTFTAYTACRPDVEGCGATYPDQTVHSEGNLVSAHAWPDLPGFMKKFVQLVNSR